MPATQVWQPSIPVAWRNYTHSPFFFLYWAYVFYSLLFPFLFLSFSRSFILTHWHETYCTFNSSCHAVLIRPCSGCEICSIHSEDVTALKWTMTWHPVRSPPQDLRLCLHHSSEVNSGVRWHIQCHHLLIHRQSFCLLANTIMAIFSASIFVLTICSS